MQRHFDEELQELKGRLIYMGSLAEKMTDEAIKGLVRREDQTAVIEANEKKVNELHIEIDETVVKLIALHHPVASDLRFLIMASKICGELERVADQAVNICENTGYLLKSPPLKPLVDLPIMADIACTMLRESLDAVMKADVSAAQQVLDTDDKVDAFKDQIFRELLTYMMSDPTTIPRALALILIARNVERIGDHATNIAEGAIYLVQGRDVRHHHEEKNPDAKK
jgi:phosphate transport system protein